MGPREYLIDTRDQGTMGGHAKNENTEASLRIFTEGSSKSRGRQERGYIQGWDGNSDQRRSTASSDRRRGSDDRSDSPDNAHGGASHDCDLFSIQRRGGVGRQESRRRKHVPEDPQSREPRHSESAAELLPNAKNLLSSLPSSPPLTPTTPSAVSSPSPNRKRESYSPELSALTYMKTKSPLTTLETPASYTDKEVERRLRFLDKTHSRNLTPRSRIFLELHQKTSLLLLLLLLETDSTKRAMYQTSLQLLDNFLEENSTILDETKSHAELRENLSRLKLFEYHSRYGEYFAYQSVQLKKVATEVQTTGYKIFRNYWDKVSRDIVREMKQIKDHFETPPSRLQSYLALMNAAAAMGVDFDHLLTSISAYATRNNLMHSTVNELIQAGRFHDLAKILHEDECDLPLIISYERLQEKEALLQIIATIKEEILEVHKDFPDDYRCGITPVRGWI